MTSVFDELAFAAPDDDADGLDEDEHAPRPAASRPAAVMAMSPRELR
ncbi:MAG TPA: hypothetical protein VMR00_13260 [Streptosporangiaceae bacterium]|jgi:hypothetical protein|nr:hypothetical protein [Streptosporangiaceae bacterium]